jgi:hypothetical protein
VKSPTFKTLSSHWSLQAADDGHSCLLNFSVEFATSGMLAGHAINAVFPEMARQQMDAFENRCATVTCESAANHGFRRKHAEPPPTLSQLKRSELPSPCLMSLAALFKQYSKPCLRSGRVLSAVVASSGRASETMDASGFQAACAHANRPTGILANLNSFQSSLITPLAADLGDPSFVRKVFCCLDCDSFGNAALNDCILAVLMLHGVSSVDRQHFQVTASSFLCSEKLKERLHAVSVHGFDKPDGTHGG